MKCQAVQRSLGVIFSLLEKMSLPGERLNNFKHSLYCLPLRRYRTEVTMVCCPWS